MKKYLFRILSFLMVLTMVLSMAPMTALPVFAEGAEVTELTGMKLSVLGDSISTFKNWSDGTANDTVNNTLGAANWCYNGARFNVETADETWWKQTADQLGMEVLVDNAWSGSHVFSTGSEGAGFVPGAYIDRCVNLHPNIGDKVGQMPDVIAVYLGTNDFYQAPQLVGSYAAITDEVWAQIEAGTHTPTTTAEAYAIMLQKISNTYPDAQVYCFTLLPACNATNDAALRLFNADIAALANRYGATLVDLYNDSGIQTEASAFYKMMGDTLHPNDIGMDAITAAFKSALLRNNGEAHEISYALDGVMTVGGKPSAVTAGGELMVKLEATNADNTRVIVEVKDANGEPVAHTFKNGTVAVETVTSDLTVTALATGGYGHGNHEGWTVWSDTDKANITAALEADGGKLVFENGGRISDTIDLDGKELTVCLNGQTVTIGAARAFRLVNGAKLTFCDCTAHGSGDAYTAGTIKVNRGGSTNPLKGAVAGLYNGNNTFTLYDGIIDGGNMTNNAAATADAMGGLLDMYSASSIVLHRGKLQNFTADQGAGIWAKNGSVQIDSEVQFNNLHATGYVADDAKGALKGVGGAIYAGDATVTISGVVFTNCTAIQNGAAIYAGNAVGVSVSGATVAEGMFLSEGNQLAVDALTAGANIDVETAQTAELQDVFAATANTPVINNTANWLTYNEKPVCYNTAKGFYYAVEGHYHAACACAISGATCDSHAGAAAEENWEAWTSNNSLPTKGGRYYLTQNVALKSTYAVPGSVYLCLNGYSITRASDSTSTGALLQTNTADETPQLTLMNCKAEITDGKLVSNDKTSKISGGNNTSSGGGAIYLNRKGIVNLIGVEICNNTGSYTSNDWTAGGILLRYEGASASGSIDNMALNTNYVRFAENAATGTNGRGGAITLRGGKVNINNTVFYKNTAVQGGGAIHMPNTYAAEVTIKNSLFDQNTVTATDASLGGAGMNIALGSVSMTNVTMTGNTNAGHQGSAISLTGGSLSLKDCTIQNNKNTLNATYKAAIVVQNSATFKVSGKTVIDNNIAGTKESNVFLRQATAKMTVGALTAGSNISIETKEHGNTDGAAVTDPAKFLNVSTEQGNSTPTMTLDKNGYYISYTNNGKAVAYENGTFSFVDNVTHYHAACACAITDATCQSHASGNGADVPWTEWTSTTTLPTTSGNYYLTADVKLSTTSVDTSKTGQTINICLNGYNIVKAEGATLGNGLIRIADNTNMMIMNCKATLSGGKLAANSAGLKNGGSTVTNVPGVFWVNQGVTLTLLGVEVSNNRTSGASAGGWAAGGIMMANYDTNHNPQQLKIDYCTFASNATLGTGGGGAISLRNGSADIRNTVFKNNEALERGGAIWMSNGATQLKLENCEFNGNTAGVSGGALCIAAGNNVSISNCDFKYNKVYGTAGGGAIYAGKGMITVSNTDFTGNTATYIGAAIAIPGSTTTQLSVTGGKFYVNEITQKDKSGAKLSSDTNVDGGAALHIGSGTATYNNVSVQSNTSVGKHGTAFTVSGGTLTLNSTTVKNNTNTASATYRGAIVVINSSGNITVSGATVVDNNTCGNKESNLFLRETSAKLTVGKLTAGANVHVGGHKDVVAYEDPGLLLNAVASGDNATPTIQSETNHWLVYDNRANSTDEYLQNNSAIGYKDGEFFFYPVSADKWVNVGGESYPTVEDALENVNPGAANNVVTLGQEIKESVTLPATTGEQAVQIDLNGQNIAQDATLSSTGEKTVLHVADSKLTYNSETPTVIAKDAIGTNVEIPKEYKVGNRRYVAIETATGYEIHRVQLTITAKTLRPRNDGVGFKVKFSAASSLSASELIAGFGMNFAVKDGDGNYLLDKEGNKKVTPMNIKKEGATLVNNTGEFTVVIADFLKDNTDLVEQGCTVEGTPFITLANGEQVIVETTGKAVEISFMDMVSYAESTWNSGMSQVQKEAIADMYNRNEAVMSDWSIDMTNIKTLAAERK